MRVRLGDTQSAFRASSFCTSPWNWPADTVPTLRLLDEKKVMTCRNRINLLVAFILSVSPILSIAQEAKSKEIIDGLELTEKEWEKLRRGEVVTISGEDWEQTDREMAFDSAILVGQQLETVLAKTLYATSLIPKKEIRDAGKLTGEGDFAGAKFDVASSRDVTEAKKLLAAQPGKSFNFSKREISEISKMAEKIEPGSPDSTFVDVANQALRIILAARYRAYLTDGLNGGESGDSIPIY